MTLFLFSFLSIYVVKVAICVTHICQDTNVVFQYAFSGKGIIMELKHIIVELVKGFLFVRIFWKDYS